MIEFAKAVNASKIVVSCSSSYKCAFSKYVEIPMCHSLLAADIPDERHDFYSSFILSLDPLDSDDIIKDRLVYYLRHDKEREALTLKGVEAVKQHTMKQYAERFISEIEKFLKNREKNNSFTV